MHAVVGVLSDDTDPMVTVMKLEKAPQETYADIGGLDQQIQVSICYLRPLSPPRNHAPNSTQLCNNCFSNNLGNQRIR